MNRNMTIRLVACAAVAVAVLTLRAAEVTEGEAKEAVAGWAALQEALTGKERFAGRAIQLENLTQSRRGAEDDEDDLEYGAAASASQPSRSSQPSPNESAWACAAQFPLAASGSAISAVEFVGDGVFTSLLGEWSEMEKGMRILIR